MTKRLKIILIFLIICLIGVGVFSFLNIQKKESAQTKTTPNLKLLTSHSSPEAGENWVVYFETTGASDLIITPKDKDSTEDLDFVSLTCESEEINPEIQAGDVLFVSNWSCDGVGVVTHLVNIARKHTLKFQFGEKLAFAYNNPDSVTDSFTDESKIAATSSVTVSSGQVKLSTLKANGESCSSGSECSSTFCVDSVCCNNICNGTPCYRCDGYSNAGAGTCGYISTAVDPDSECTTIAPPAADSCKSANCSGSSSTCGYLAAGEQSQPVCKRCNGNSYDPVNISDNTQDAEGSNTCGTTTSICKNCDGGGSCVNQTASEDLFNQCSVYNNCAVTFNGATNLTCTQKCATIYKNLNGWCDGSGACAAAACACSSIGTDGGGSNTVYNRSIWSGILKDCVASTANGTCATVMISNSCDGYSTNCLCQ